MKGHSSCWLLLLVSINLFSQEFSMKLIFENNSGARDSLVVGYDSSASDTIDSFFSEVNIKSDSLDSLLDVRIPIYADPFIWDSMGVAQVKRQITMRKCDDQYLSEKPVPIDVYSSSWPIKISWNVESLKDSCHRGSFLTTIHPKSWFDSDGHTEPFLVQLAQQDHVLYKKYVQVCPSDNCYFYQGKMIIRYWMAFDNQFSVSINELPQSQQFKISLTNGVLLIKSERTNLSRFKAVLLDLSGTIINQNIGEQMVKLNIQNMQNKICVLQIISKGNVLTKKVFLGTNFMTSI